MSTFDPTYTSDPVTIDNTTVCSHNLFEREDWLETCYIISTVLFIVALKGLGKQETSVIGNLFGCLGMLTGIIATIFSKWVCGDGYQYILSVGIPGILIGVVFAHFVTMIKMPQMVGLLNSFGGLASVLEAIALFVDTESRYGPNGLAQGDISERNAEVVVQSIALYLSIIVGAITFSGSIIACLKLNGNISSTAKCLPFRKMFLTIVFGGIVALFMLADNSGYGSRAGLIYLIIALIFSLVQGVIFTLAIGGADMPVVICILNTGSGFAGVFAGFMLANKLLVIGGSFVGCSGLVLTVIMCRAMNRSMYNVLFSSQSGYTLSGIAGKFSSEGITDNSNLISALEKSSHIIEEPLKEVSIEDLSVKLTRAKKVLIVPGYGMAAGKAQHAAASMISCLKNRGVKVIFGIHPVAGRLPGHLNVLLAEARIPYDLVKSMDFVNPMMEEFDVCLVIGANDIVNPAAVEDSTCAIAGMPVIEVWRSKLSVVIKRGGGAGYSGVENPLFRRPNNYMLFGGAKQMLEALTGVASRTAEKNQTSIDSDEISIQGYVEEAIEYSSYPVMYTIGALKEKKKGESRVSLTPDVCRSLRKMGYGVLIETDAGNAAGISDTDYINSGCQICMSAGEVCRDSQLIFTINFPESSRRGDGIESSSLGLLPSEDDMVLKQMRGKFVVSWIGRLTDSGKDIVSCAAILGINLIDVTAVPRVTIAQALDCLSSQAKIAGHRAVIEAVSSFGRFLSQEINAAGEFPPARVVVLGAGVAGLAAVGTAVSLGCEVRAWDVRDVKDQVESMGAKWIKIVHSETGEGVGGYAKESSDEFIKTQRDRFAKELRKADIVITTAAIPGKVSPRLIEEHMVRDMKGGSVIVDLGCSSSFEGGNCLLSVCNQEIYFKGDHGVVKIVGYTNLASRMPEQASRMYSANMKNLLTYIHSRDQEPSDAGKFETNILKNLGNAPPSDIIIRSVVCSYNGDVLDHVRPPTPHTSTKKDNTRISPSIETGSECYPPVIATNTKTPFGFVPIMRSTWETISSKLSRKQKTGIAHKEKMDNQNHHSMSLNDIVSFVFLLVIGIGVLVVCGLFAPKMFIDLILVFILSGFIGYTLVVNVEPALHTPLMSVSNAISGLVILGGMFMVSNDYTVTTIIATVAIGVSAMNVGGGFAITHRMLSMF